MASGDGIKVTIRGEKKVRDLIRKYQDRMDDLSSPFAEFGEYKLREIRKQWDREEDPYGNPWKPLAPATIEEKRRNNQMLGILVRTTTLRDSFTYKEKPQSLTIGTNIKYAPKHQLGISVPKREMLGVNESDIKELLDTFLEYLPE